jgi:hypothetical protein|tara:strand:+ start:1324 stop:1752 length:429 start_codon:yes stop_codon:yes gene_type:complete
MIYEIRDVIPLVKSNNNYWTMTNNDYNTLDWKEINYQSKPTYNELIEKVNELNNIKPMILLREKRDELLDKTDKYMVSDFAYPTEQFKQDWLDYREELRNLPSNSSPQVKIIKSIETDNESLILQRITDIELYNVNWPIPPS